MKRFKIMVQESIAYKDMKLVLQRLEGLGYNITLVDNGNIVCENTEGKNE